MSVRILILLLAVAVCALWPQGLVLCVGDHGHVGLEPDCAPCCPVGREDCVDCRAYESPDLATVAANPTVPGPDVQSAPISVPTSDGPEPAATEEATSPRRDEAGLETVVLIV